MMNNNKMDYNATPCPWMRVGENNRVWCNLFDTWVDLMVQQYPYVCEDYECCWQKKNKKK